MSHANNVIWKRRIDALPNGLTLKQAAQRLRTRYQSTRYYIIKFGYVFDDGRLAGSVHRQIAAKKTYGNVDWTMQDAAIARHIGRTREAVRLVRRHLGYPPSNRATTRKCSCRHCKNRS